MLLTYLTRCECIPCLEFYLRSSPFFAREEARVIRDVVKVILNVADSLLFLSVPDNLKALEHL